MDTIFVLSFLLFLLGAVIRDRKKLKGTKRSLKAVYNLMTLLTLGLLICHLYKIRIPLPPRFFIHYVSPWVSSMIGL
jgi:hypothetical protein